MKPPFPSFELCAQPVCFIFKGLVLYYSEEKIQGYLSITLRRGNEILKHSANKQQPVQSKEAEGAS